MSHSKISVDQLIRFTAQTAGRDKVYRTLQYACRFLAWFQLRKGAPNNAFRPVEFFQNVEFLMSITRKGN